MDKRLPYVLLVILMLALNFFVFLTPYLASKGDAAAGTLYVVFAPTCHQLTSRSLCLFVDDGNYSIGDCFEEGKLIFTRQNEVEKQGQAGYKLPVCARDTAIYLAMLVGLLILPFFQKIESEEMPNKWIIVAAAVPIAIDGVSQLVGMRESSNFLRVVTGAIVGVVLPFYILPIVNMLVNAAGEKLGKKKRRK